MLANEKNISVDALLQVLVEALATAYKRRPGAAPEVMVSIEPGTMDPREAVRLMDEKLPADIHDLTFSHPQ